MGGVTAAPLPEAARRNVAGRRLFLPRAGTARCKICFHQLWRLGRTSGSAGNAPTCAAVERILRRFPLRRRIRSRSHHARHGLQFALPGIFYARFLRRGSSMTFEKIRGGRGARAKVNGTEACILSFGAIDGV